MHNMQYFLHKSLIRNQQDYFSQYLRTAEYYFFHILWNTYLINHQHTNYEQSKHDYV